MSQHSEDENAAFCLHYSDINSNDLLDIPEVIISIKLFDPVLPVDSSFAFRLKTIFFTQTTGQMKHNIAGKNSHSLLIRTIVRIVSSLVINRPVSETSHIGGFPKFEALYCGLNLVSSTEIS